MDRGWSWRFAGSRRVQRNNNFELNPIPEREHSETLDRGDPELLPEFVSNMELGLIKKLSKGSFLANAYYQYSKNPLQRVNSVYADTILHRVFTNAVFSDRWGSEFGGEWKILPKMRILGGMNIYNYRISGSVMDYEKLWSNRDWGVNEQRITTQASDFFTTTNYVYEKNVLLLNLKFNLKQLGDLIKLPKSEFGEKEF